MEAEKILKQRYAPSPWTAKLTESEQENHWPRISHMNADPIAFIRGDPRPKLSDKPVAAAVGYAPATQTAAFTHAKTNQRADQRTKSRRVLSECRA